MSETYELEDIGTIIMVSHYNTQGQLHGPRTHWYPNGRYFKQEYYQAGQLVKFVTTWNPDGSQKSKEYITYDDEPDEYNETTMYNKNLSDCRELKIL